jgi:CBS domain-containing protein
MDVHKILEAKGGGTVFTLPLNSSVSDFVKLACEKRVGAMLVTDKDGKLAGIITERDVLRLCNAGANLAKTKVADVMTRILICARPEDDVNVVMDIMVSRRIRHLPIVSGQEIKGLITVRDVIYAMRKAEQDEVVRLVEYLRSSADDASASEKKGEGDA